MSFLGFKDLYPVVALLLSMYLLRPWNWDVKEWLLNILWLVVMLVAFTIFVRFIKRVLDKQERKFIYRLRVNLLRLNNMSWIDDYDIYVDDAVESEGWVIVYGGMLLKKEEEDS